MNVAAVFSFLHPMLSIVIAAVYVLYILNKDYASYQKRDSSLSLQEDSIEKGV